MTASAHTSTSWTLFDLADADHHPVAGRVGIRTHAAVANTDPGGSTLLSVRYEPGASDVRQHAVGQVLLVLEGELRVEGTVCRSGAGCFAPAGAGYRVEAGPLGALAVEFRPAPVAYGVAEEDNATMPVKPPSTPQPQYWATMQSAGPVTSVHELSFFDMATMPEARVSPEMTIQALVNHAEDDGHSMLMVRHWPNSVTAAHSHDVDQIVLVLDGSISQGNRRFTRGMGFFTPKGRRYMLTAGEEGTVRVEWRPSPLTFSTDWVENGR